jgi:hypothetical protein
MCHRFTNSFGRTRWYSEVTRFISVRLEIVLIMTQERSTVCAERTIGLEIVLDAPDGTPRWRGSSESSFWLVQILMQDRCTVCAEHTIGS